MKKISILGSTGSIGTQALEVVRRHRDKFSVSALTAGHNIKLFRAQIAEFSPSLAAVIEKDDAASLSAEFPGTRFLHGAEGIKEAAGSSDAGTVLSCLVGSAGIEPTYEAVKAGKRIALANKEALVAAGSIIMPALERYGAEIIPVDSEHSAIFQALLSSPHCSPKRIVLTASGGPFRNYSVKDLASVTREEALRHPTWNMGAKVTIDSASMMNKGLEVIEAHHLFGVPAEKIEIVVHPESILHSAVEFEDGSIIGQMGPPDMKIPIAFALSYPERLPNIVKSLDFFELGAMHFEKPDVKVFRCLGLAYRAVKEGGGAAAVMNAANEAAVRAFLDGRIAFNMIPRLIENAMDGCRAEEPTSIEEVLVLEAESREHVEQCLSWHI